MTENKDKDIAGSVAKFPKRVEYRSPSLTF